MREGHRELEGGPRRQAQRTEGFMEPKGNLRAKFSESEDRYGRSLNASERRGALQKREPATMNGCMASTTRRARRQPRDCFWEDRRARTASLQRDHGTYATSREAASF